MQYHEAVAALIQANGSERRYIYVSNGLPFAANEPVSCDQLTNVPFATLEEEDWGLIPVADLSVMARRNHAVFIPQPVYARMTKVGTQAPYVWEFNEGDLWDQLDWIRVEYRVRLEFGATAHDLPGWRALFVDAASIPFRRVHKDQSFAHFLGRTPKEALWKAIRDIREYAPTLDNVEYVELSQRLAH